MGPGAAQDPARLAAIEPGARLWWWLPPIVVTLAIQLWLAAKDTVPSIDGMAYLEAGEHLFAGDGFVRQGRPETHFPPVGAVVLGLLQKVTTSEIAAVRIVDVVSILAVIGLLVLIARRLSGDERVAVATLWLAGTAAGIGTALHRGGGGTEAPTLALVLGATLLVLDGFSAEVTPTKRVAQSAVAGLLCGLGYLTRPEALLPAAVLGVAILVLGWRRLGPTTPTWRRLAPVAAFGVAVLVFVVPYVAYLHSNTGRWQLTDKAQTASAASWRSTAGGNRSLGDRSTYTTDDGTRTSQSLVSIIREDPGKWLGIVGTNVRQLAYSYGGLSPGNPIPLLPTLFLLPAGWAAWRARRDGPSLLVLAIGVTALVVSLGFLVLPRYLLGFTAVLALFAAWGLIDLYDRGRGWQRPMLLAVTGLLVLGGVTQALIPPDAPDGTIEPTEQVAAGRWLAGHTAPGSRIMTRSFAVQHYADRPVVALPAGSYEDVLAYARAHGVRYLVADEHTIRDRRPDLAGPLLDGEPHPGLREVATLDEPRGVVKIYALDPPPPESALPDRPLGYIGD